MTCSITAFDTRSFGRSFAIAAISMALAATVMVSTDGEPVCSGARAARLGVLAPVLGALGAVLAIAQARSRGELLALASMGVHPWRAFAGAWAASFLFAIAGAMQAAWSGSNLEALFPRVPTTDWLLLADGTWSSASAGVMLGPLGVEQAAFVAANPSAMAWSPPRVGVLVTIALAGVVLPVWLESRRGWREKVLVGGVAIVVEIAAFHFVGAARVGGWALVCGPALMIAHGVMRR